VGRTSSEADCGPRLAIAIRMATSSGSCFELDKHVKVASLGENLHVGELELGGIPSAPDLTRDLAEFFNSLLGENRFAETRKTSATFAQPRSTVAIPEYSLSA